MPEVIHTTIVGVEERVVTSKKDNKQYTFRDVLTGAGEKLQASKEIATLAQNMRGFNVIGVVETTVNGDFTNKNLISLELAPSIQQPSHDNQLSQPTFDPGPQPGQYAAQASQEPPLYAQQAMQAQTASAATGSPQTASQTEKDERIARQTATKVAAQLSSSVSSEFWQNVAILIDFYRTGQVPLADPIYVEDLPF